MAEVLVEEEVAAPAARVWELVRGFGDIQEWASGIESCSVEGEGVGAVRTIGVPGGLSLQERLESYDEAGRSFGYAIIGDNPLPFSDYHSVFQVKETGPDRCAIEWRGKFEASPDGVAQAEGIVRGIYTGGIASLKKKLGV